jgi:hypothetical protein
MRDGNAGREGGSGLPAASAALHPSYKLIGFMEQAVGDARKIDRIHWIGAELNTQQMPPLQQISAMIASLDSLIEPARLGRVSLGNRIGSRPKVSLRKRPIRCIRACRSGVRRALLFG